MKNVGSGILQSGGIWFTGIMLKQLLSLPPAPRIAAICLMLAAVFGVIVAASDDPIDKLLLGSLAALLVAGAMRLATPVEVRALWLRHASLALAGGLAFTAVAFRIPIEEALIKVALGLLGEWVPLREGVPLPIPANWLVALTLGFMLAAIWIINLPNRSTVALRRTRSEILNDPDSRADREQLIRELTDALDELEKELNWNHEHYVPLEADVDLVLAYDRRKQAGDLLTAIRDNARARLFIVLGDPGSGKSVALRACPGGSGAL